MGAALSARTIFTGFGLGLVYKTAMVALKGWKDTPEKVFGPPFAAGSMAAEISPELLGVGYIIGPRIASIMCAGGVLAYLVLIPLIKFFGASIPGPLAPGTIPIARHEPQPDPQRLRALHRCGAVAAGGIISLLRSLPMIWQRTARRPARRRGAARGAGRPASHRARPLDEGGVHRDRAHHGRDHAGPPAPHELARAPR